MLVLDVSMTFLPIAGRGLFQKGRGRLVRRLRQARRLLPPQTSTDAAAPFHDCSGHAPSPNPTYQFQPIQLSAQSVKGVYRLKLDKGKEEMKAVIRARRMLSLIIMQSVLEHDGDATEEYLRYDIHHGRARNRVPERP